MLGSVETKADTAITVNQGEDMNTLQVKGIWNVVKGRLKQRWAELTDDDLRYVEGQEDELVGRIQKRTGATRAAIERSLNEG